MKNYVINLILLAIALLGTSAYCQPLKHSWVNYDTISYEHYGKTSQSIYQYDPLSIQKQDSLCFVWVRHFENDLNIGVREAVMRDQDPKHPVYTDIVDTYWESGLQIDTKNKRQRKLYQNNVIKDPVLDTVVTTVLRFHVEKTGDYAWRPASPKLLSILPALCFKDE